MTSPDLPEPGSLTRSPEWWARLVYAHRIGEQIGRTPSQLTVSNTLYGEGYERGLEVARADAVAGHLLCALSSMVVGVVVGLML